MKKIILLIAIFFVQAGLVLAQSGSDWVWANSSGTANQNPGNRVKEVVTDAAGNVYTAGTFEGVMTVGGLTVSTSGDATTGGYDEDIFVAKYNAAGTLLWLKKFGLSGPGNNQEALVMDIDQNGNIYVGGSGGSGYSYHGFLVKFDNDGNQIWAKTDFTLFEVNGITIAPDGNPVIMEISQSAKNIFKINAANGNVLWQVSNTNAGDNAAAVYKDFIDDAGNIYYCLFNLSAASTVIAGQSFSATGLTSYIASLDNNGNTRWVQKIDNRQLQLNYYIDNTGKSYLSLAGGGGATWQGIPTTGGGYGYFELNNAGTITQYKTASPYGSVFRIKPDGIYNYSYIAGSTLQVINGYGDYMIATPNSISKGIAVVVKYDKNTQAVVWANTCEFTSANNGAGAVNSLNVTNDGKVILVGSYSLTATFGSITKTATPTNSLNPKDFYVAKFDQANIAPPAVTNWTGNAGNSNWNDAANWDNGIPNGNVKTNIPSGASSYPANIPATVTPGKLEIGAGVTLQLPLAMKSPLGIVNNGVIILNEAGYFYSGFDGGNSAIIGGTGKVVIKNSGLSFAGGTKPFVNSLEIDCPGARISAFGGTINGSLYITNGMLIGSDYSPIVIDDPNGVITYTATSYYTGALKRKVNANGTYILPVAKVTSYAPYTYTPVQTATIQLKDIVGPQYITATFNNTINGAAPNATAGGQTVTQLLNNGFWTLTPDVALTGGSYSVTLQGGGFTNGVAEAGKYVVLKRANSSNPWAFSGNNGIASQTASYVQASATGITGFSDFAIGIANNIVETTLPVTFQKFTAVQSNNSVYLAWETASETNCDKFVVERSTDGKTFLPIGEKQAQGTTLSTTTQYAYEDSQPVAGKDFYRLKQIDLDGKFAYSEIRQVAYHPNNTGTFVYSNPIAQSFSISGNKIPISQVRIIDIAGKTVFVISSPSNNILLPTTITNGWYVLQIQYSDGTSSTHKIVVKK